jgi:hypothetical protein
MKRKEGGKPARFATPRPRAGGDYADPYKKVRRPRPPAGGDAPEFVRRPRPAVDADAPPHARERRPRWQEAGEGGYGGRERRAREEGGFTVTLDSDVARVFRGDASVNKALRLVMQLMHVVQGPPRMSAGRRPPGERRGGYQGSPEARGFSRKPRFEDDEQ